MKLRSIVWTIFSILKSRGACRGNSANACQTNMKHKSIVSTMGLHSWCFLTLIRCESCELFNTSSLICYPEESGPEIK